MEKLEYVLALAEEKNLTRAAARLYISQPALTNYLNRLERDLGVRLFDRSVQPIEITRAGRIYIEDMKKIQSRELALMAKLQSISRPGRTFAIGVPSLRGEDLLPEPLAAFHREYPEVSIEIDTRVEEHLEKELDSGGLDLIIGALSMAYSGFHYEYLGEEPMYLLVPRSAQYLPQPGTEDGTQERPFLLDGAELNGECFLLPGTGGGQYGAVMRLLRKHGIMPGSEIHCGNLHTLYQLAGEGCGVLFTYPGPFARSFPQYAEKLACCVIQKEIMTQKMYLAWRLDSDKQDLIQAFCRCLKSKLQPRET